MCFWQAYRYHTDRHRTNRYIKLFEWYTLYYNVYGKWQPIKTSNFEIPISKWQTATIYKLYKNLWSWNCVFIFVKLSSDLIETWTQSISNERKDNQQQHGFIATREINRMLLDVCNFVISKLWRIPNKISN